MSSELGVDSRMSLHLTTVACDKTAERIHVAVAAVRNDLACIHRRIGEGGVTKATVRRRHKISVGSSTSGYTMSPLSPKTPLPTSSPRRPLQHSKPSQLSPLRDPRHTGARTRGGSSATTGAGPWRRSASRRMSVGRRGVSADRERSWLRSVSGTKQSEDASDSVFVTRHQCLSRYRCRSPSCDPSVCHVSAGFDDFPFAFSLSRNLLNDSYSFSSSRSVHNGRPTLSTLHRPVPVRPNIASDAPSQ